MEHVAVRCPGPFVRLACTLGMVMTATVAVCAEPGHGNATAAPARAADTVLSALVAEAARNNPEIQAAEKERAAASQRVSVAGALEDPMLEAGVLNVPTRTFSFSREDMTMKMLGLSQRLPYPGKRELRRQVAQGDAEAVTQGYRETVNRVLRDLKLAYYDLALSVQSQRAVTQNRALVMQLLKLAEGRYAVAQAGQIDVLRAQTAYSRMTEELIKLERERPVLEAEMDRLLGRKPAAVAVVPAELAMTPVELAPARLYERALNQRPQLLSLQAMVARSERSLELARKDRYPDFDVRLSYGQRDSMPDGTPRSDMVSLTVAINLPVWRETKVEPRIAEAQALHEQALSMYEAQRNETAVKLRQQATIAEQSARAASLYVNEIAPQARLSVEAALAAYQVNRIELAALLENRMAVLNADIAHAAALAAYNKALAEIDFLVGTAVPESQGATTP